MRKIILLIAMLSILVIPNLSLAQHKVEVWEFGSVTCSHCRALRNYIEKKVATNPQIDYTYFEVGGISNQDNRNKLDMLKVIYGAAAYTGIPITFIGDQFIKGNRPDEVDSAIEICEAKGCESPSQKLIAATTPPATNTNTNQSNNQNTNTNQDINQNINNNQNTNQPQQNDKESQKKMQKEEIIGWIILVIFVLIVVGFGIKIIRERNN